MNWASPMAWLLAVGVLGPLAAHLLSQRPPRPRPFPTLRFVRATANSARRLRALHDRWLWLLRTTIVVIVAGAAAGPTLTTAWRIAAWNPPVQEAMVIGPGVDGRDATGADAVETDADSWRYTGRSVRSLVAAAVADLEEVRDRRRALVVRWLGDAREFAPEDAATIPPDIGLTLEPLPGPAGAPTPGRFELLSAADDATVGAWLLDAWAWQGRHAVTVVWPGAAMRQQMLTDARAASPELTEMFRRMRLDPRLAEAARRSGPDPRTDGAEALDRARFAPVAIAADGAVLLWGAEVGTRALLVLDARPRDPVALWTLRTALDAARAIDGWPRPSRSWTADERAAYQRGPGTTPAVALPPGLDTRWWWSAALVLLLIEQRVRRRRTHAILPASPETTRDAA